MEKTKSIVKNKATVLTLTDFLQCVFIVYDWTSVQKMTPVFYAEGIKWCHVLFLFVFYCHFILYTWVLSNF